MKTLVAAFRTAGKALLLAGAVAIATFPVGQETRPASASETEIFISRSSMNPLWDSTILLYPDGSPVEVYVWATGVDATYGAGAFDVHFSYDDSLISVTSLTEDTGWLESTYRSAACIAPWWAGTAPFVRTIPGDPDGLSEGYVGCHTPLPPPPFGPQGSGVIAKITIEPGPERATTAISLSYGSRLIDTGYAGGGGVDPAVIPATVRSSYVLLAKCADFNGDGVVDLMNDVFDIANRFDMTPADPGWDPMYDLNDDDIVDLFNDIFTAAMQFDMHC